MPEAKAEAELPSARERGHHGFERLPIRLARRSVRSAPATIGCIPATELATQFRFCRLRMACVISTVFACNPTESPGEQIGPSYPKGCAGVVEPLGPACQSSRCV